MTSECFMLQAWLCCWKKGGLALLATLIWLLGNSLADTALQAQEKRLYEQDPYDEITLNDGTKLRVKPLQDLPKNPKGTTPITVELLDHPGEQYRIRWGEIAQIRRFPQLLLDKVNQLVDQKQFEEAYDYLIHIKRFYPKLSGYAEAFQRFLWHEAQHHLQQGRRDRALQLLHYLQEQNAKYPGLKEALGRVVMQKAQEYLRRKDYESVRHLLQDLLKRYPKHPAASQVRNTLEAEARKVVQQAQARWDQGQLFAARKLALRAVRIWPVPEAVQLLQRAQQRVPLVRVAVDRLARSNLPRLDDWAALRVARLYHRRLAELLAPGPSGGQYACPWGKLELMDLGSRLRLTLRAGLTWNQDNRPLVAADVAATLAAMADSRHPFYQPAWAAAVRQIRTPDTQTVEVFFSRSPLNPLALLNRPLYGWDQLYPPLAPPQNGPYRLGRQTKDRMHFVAVEGYFATGRNQPREIVEYHFARSQDALTALRYGEVEVWDRVPPWLKNALPKQGVRLQRYAWPTIHCLVFNPDKPLLRQRTFRRGLLYALNRQAILEYLHQGNDLDGSQVISAPLPAPRKAGDLIGYAYDETVAPRPFNPHLGLVLIALAQRAMAAREQADRKKDGAELSSGQSADPRAGKRSPQAQEPPKDENEDSPPPPLPKLVLVHPPSETARIACRRIKAYWERLGMEITLREADPQQPLSDYDLRYVELVIQEPVVDVYRLFGQQGLLGDTPAYVRLAIRQMARAPDWRSLGQRLRRLHQLLHQDVTVLPLWQLSEYAAVREELKGVDQDLVNLYQNVERWVPPKKLTLGPTAQVP